MTPKFLFALREDLKEHKEFLPTKAHETDTGYDVRAAQEDRKPIVLQPFQKVAIPLGFRGFCPPGWWYEIKPRSSTFAKKSLHALYGTIDEAYEGQLVFSAQYIPQFEFIHTKYDNSQAVLFNGSFYNNLVINFGDAVGQIIPIKRQEMDIEGIDNDTYDNLCKERAGSRGTGGFGSTS